MTRAPLRLVPPLEQEAETAPLAEPVVAPEPPPRIAMVGVDPRHRGGIAQFGANLARVARQHADLRALTYRRQYPRWTRPGRQPPEPSGAEPPCPTHAVLIPWSPLSWLRAVRQLRRFDPHLVVFQWWNPIFGPCIAFLAAHLRAAGARVVTVCHNDRPHERFPLWRPLTRLALRRADLLVALSSPVAERIRALVPGVTVEVRHHPPNLVPDGHRDGPADDVWRRRLEAIEGPILLFFGNVRRYKGLEDLLAAMPLVRQHVGATLVVAGHFFEPVERLRGYAAAAGARPDQDVRFFPGYVPAGEVPALFARADLVVLPYRAATQSGVLAQAAAAGRPVVATAVGGLPEAVDGRGVLVAPGDPAALAAGIVEALRAPPAPPQLPPRGWEEWSDLLIEQATSAAAERPADAAREVAGWRGWAPLTGALAVVASVGSGIVAHGGDWPSLWGDAATHMLHARRLLDSATPGFAQLGSYWPPLQHMLAAPLAWIDPLYTSMWAGSIAAMALFVLAVAGAYRLGVELTGHRAAGALAGLAIVANPNMLYLQASPMLESAIAFGLLWAAASLMRFARTGRFMDVVVAGLCSSVAVWTTWAAMILPFYGAAVVIAVCRRYRFARPKIEAYALAYAVAASYTLILWMGWNFYIQKDPLYVLDYHQPVGQLVGDRAFVAGHPGDPVFVVTNYGAAVTDLLGPVAVAMIVAVALGALARGRLFHPAGVALLGTGLVLTYLFVRGTAVGSPLWADWKHLADGEARNLNIRYALWTMPFLAVAAAVLAGRTRRRQLAVLGALVAGSAWFLPALHGTSTVDPPPQAHAVARYERSVARALQHLTGRDDGRILMSSINGGDRLIWLSRLDASRFITEANGDRFARTLRHPGADIHYVFVTPGSTVEERLSAAALARKGFRPVWSSHRPDAAGLRYTLLERGVR